MLLLCCVFSSWHRHASPLLGAHFARFHHFRWPPPPCRLHLLATYPGPVKYPRRRDSSLYYDPTNTPPTLVKYKVKSGRS